MNKRRRHYWGIVLLILGAFALRLYQLDMVPLRGDEAFSAQYWAGLPLIESLTDIATIEPHPPLTYVIFSLWGEVFGIENAWLLRLLSVFGGVLGVAGSFTLGRILGNTIKQPTIAWWVALFWTLHPFLIWHAQDFRNYALWVSLSTLVIASFLLLLRHFSTRNSLRFIVFAVITSLVFYFEVITLATLWLYSVYELRKKRTQFITITGYFALIVAITGIVFIALQGQLIGSGSYTGTTGGFTWATLSKFPFVLGWGDTYPADISLWLGLAMTFGLLGIIVYARSQGIWKRFILPSLLIVVPVLLLSIIATQMNVFRPRYIMMSIVGIGLMLAIGVDWLWHQQRRFFATGVAVLWVGIALWGLQGYFFTNAYRKAPDWQTLIQFVADHSDDNDLIIQTGIDAAFGYYYQVIAPQANEVALPSHPNQSIDEIHEQLEIWSEQYENLWVVGRTLPDWNNIGVVEDWAQNNMQALRQTNIGNLPATEYIPYAVHSDIVATFGRPIAIWKDTVALLNIEIFPSSPNDSFVTVVTYWRTIAPTPTPLTTFVHLVRNINPKTNTPLWAQDDHPIQHGRLNSQIWQRDMVYREVYRVDVQSVPVGDYALQLGFYDDTGTRVVRESGDDVLILEAVSLNNSSIQR
jgi:hypothetical protein